MGTTRVLMKKIVDDIRLMAKICDLYYNKEMDQKAIAKQLNISRPTISRLLHNAKEQGIVKISIQFLEQIDYVELEKELESLYKLEEVILVDSDRTDLKRKLGKAAALYLSRVIEDGNNVGISMGSTLYEVVDQMEPINAKDVTFIPTIGGTGLLRADLHSNSLVEKIAQICGGKYMLMHAPARVSNRLICRSLKNEKGVVEVIRSCNKLDVALVGIGCPSPDSAIMATGYYDRDDMLKFKNRGVAGDLSMQMYDIDGQTKPYEADNNVIGVNIKKLRRVPYAIGVAGGIEKINAIQGAISGRYINVLITDVDCAKELIRRKKEESK